MTPCLGALALNKDHGSLLKSLVPSLVRLFFLGGAGSSHHTAPECRDLCINLVYDDLVTRIHVMGQGPCIFVLISMEIS